MTSFVTAIKLMPGYEDYAQRLRLYIECIATHYPNKEYEIIVVEDQSMSNVALVRDYITDAWMRDRNARLIEYNATYPNPHGYNMIEAYAKNVGLHAARFPYVCITNCDLLFNDAFFDLCANRLEPNTFYRFLAYETPPVASWHLQRIERTLPRATCINPKLADSNQWTLNCIAYKSGDVMLMDRESWLKIRGFPENEIWVHSDLIVCTVVNNNRIQLKVDPNARVYTYPQGRNWVAKPFELEKSYKYVKSLVCN
jgi:hypothetical protein